MFNKWTGKNNTRVVRCVPPGATCPMGETRKMYKIVAGKVKGKGRSEDLDVDERIALKWILKKHGVS
jgi:hypothetical protein